MTTITICLICIIMPFLALMHYFAINKCLSQVALQLFVMTYYEISRTLIQMKKKPSLRKFVMWLRSPAASFYSQNLNPGVLTFSLYPGSFYFNRQPSPDPGLCTAKTCWGWVLCPEPCSSLPCELSPGLPVQRNLEHAVVICGTLCFWEMGAYTAQKKQHLPTQTRLPEAINNQAQ